MEPEGNSSAQTQDVEQTTALVPVQTQSAAVSSKQSSNNPATCISLGAAEIIVRIICTVFCIAALVAAVVTVSAITEVEDYFNYYGREYEHADSYSRGAKWMIIVAVLGSIYHFLMVFLRYLYINSHLKSLFHFYAYLNAALCAVFGLSLFAGGVANAIYASSNTETIDDISDICDQSTDISNDLCHALERVRDSEAAAASLSFFTMVIFAVLVILLVSSGVIASQETRAQAIDPASPTDDSASTRSLSSSRYGSSSNLPLYDHLYTPTDAPPPYSP